MVQRRMEKDCIAEIFTWAPRTRFSSDSSRMLWYKLRYGAATMSMHSQQDGVRLDNIVYNEQSIIYLYGICGDPQVPLMESMPLNYEPTLGSKKCRSCASLKVYNKKLVCIMRGPKGATAIKMEGCIDWNEPLGWGLERKVRSNMSVYRKNMFEVRNKQRRRLICKE